MNGENLAQQKERIFNQPEWTIHPHHLAGQSFDSDAEQTFDPADQILKLEAGCKNDCIKPAEQTAGFAAMCVRNTNHRNLAAFGALVMITGNLKNIRLSLVEMIATEKFQGVKRLRVEETGRQSFIDIIALPAFIVHEKPVGMAENAQASSLANFVK